MDGCGQRRRSLQLAFDKPGTWSQKYNLVWDSILDINLFPDSVTEKEMAFYKTKQNRYGLPLDSRENYTKLDWIIWSAAMTGKKADLMTLADPIYDFLARDALARADDRLVSHDRRARKSVSRRARWWAACSFRS